MARQRIEYIDAMRGFTMILVVYSHICHFCLGDSLLGFNGIFFLFRLPCFFFISGWLFEPLALRPFWANARHKFQVQIVPTFIFLLLLAPPPEFFRQLGAVKGGYWFTFVLFEFFILYMLTARLGRRWAQWLALAISLSSFCYARYYNDIQISAVGMQAWLVHGLGFLSVTLWRYFLFFYIGTWVRRHFDWFVQWTQKPWVFLSITIIFLLVASTPHRDMMVYEVLRFYVGGITGMWMVFVCFRQSFRWLERVHLSMPLQYIGTRTLDIYLVHFFFLPRFLMVYSPQLHAYHNSLLELVVIMGVSLIVLALSLLTSYLLRLSPFLGHYLFGVRYEQPQR